MTVIEICAPQNYSTERRYICEVVFKKWLGLECRVVFWDKDVVAVRMANAPLKCLLMPDCFFKTPATDWLTMSSLPDLPLAIVRPNEWFNELNLVAREIPVLYGSEKTNPSLLGGQEEAGSLLQSGDYYEKNGDHTYLDLDVLGAAFFMLSRYEEVVCKERDAHDRFPAKASIAYKAGFLDRPIIDEYVEVLWASMKRLWPELQRKQRKPRILVSHDVDAPSQIAFLSNYQLVRGGVGDLVKRSDYIAVKRKIDWLIGERHEIPRDDPYNQFEWLMDVSEQNGLQSAFYFICSKTHPVFDALYDIEHPLMRKLLRRIYSRGHEIGLHPSYNTYKNPGAILQEAETLKRVCQEENIVQHEWGGRMHYLRWQTPTTMHGWEQAQMNYDSTLGFADETGFRCGTCQEYPAFDVISKKSLHLRIRPLIAMECTVVDDHYMGLGYTETAYCKLINLKNTCFKVGGSFTLLWHNSNLANQSQRELYEALISDKAY